MQRFLLKWRSSKACIAHFLILSGRKKTQTNKLTRVLENMTLKHDWIYFQTIRGLCINMLTRDTAVWVVGYDARSRDWPIRQNNLTRYSQNSATVMYEIKFAMKLYLYFLHSSCKSFRAHEYNLVANTFKRGFTKIWFLLTNIIE